MSYERITSVQEVRGGTVKLGRWTREQLYLVGYDSGRFAVAYPEIGRRRRRWVELVSSELVSVA